VISFRQIHEPSGTPIKYVKGVQDGETFTEVPDEEIVKGYEYAKGQHVLIDPQEIDELKLEPKHTIDMVPLRGRERNRHPLLGEAVLSRSRW
jgi:DNA end-binding protein Ku